ncbi:phospholipase D family protein [Alginatibacterium sediminis]|uniref:Phospholipase D family protein n=1 Tax=Alginatibacterium sediminis TaxID=2164068 RepID=A0A420EHP4_9ALTE|nr:phospholipase D family protein [Alginatibacterium sediminis]RKF20219.1 phospholipase D family protein [Alginatibacterium sediminis]
MNLVYIKRLVVCYSLVLLVSACSQRPSETKIQQYKTPSYLFESDPNSLVAMRVDSLALQTNNSAIIPITDGLDAYAARIALIDHAEKGIDAQYYILKRDLTGELFLSKLYMAAQNGKRVRLLLDDLGSDDMDDLLAALSSHPNMEVRLFNAFYKRSSKISSMLFDFKRLNGRMHNKSLTADNQVTIVGGRNISDVYFKAKRDLQFYDADVVGFGPIVHEVSASFDHYWNSERSYPIELFVDSEIDVKAQLLGLENSLANRDIAPYLQQFSKYRVALANDQFLAASYECEASLLVDTPGKFVNQEHDESQLAAQLAGVLGQAKRRIIVSSPYFVPGKSGTEALVAAAQSGIKIDIITNSLAATDVAVVHGGYARYRKRLLEAGIKIWEIKPFSDSTNISFIGKGESKSSLHSKFFVVDDSHLFVGSFNWDPRSIEINTEMGIVMQCPQLNQNASQGLETKVPYLSYLVSLDGKGNIQWEEREESGAVNIYRTEPEAGFSRRFQAFVSRILPIEGQL